MRFEAMQEGDLWYVFDKQINEKIAPDPADKYTKEHMEELASLLNDYLSAIIIEKAFLGDDFL